MNKKVEYLPGNKVKVALLKNSPEMIMDGSTPGGTPPAFPEEIVACFWFTQDGYYQRANFRANVLVQVE